MKKLIDGYKNYYIEENGNVYNSNTNKYLKGSISEQGYKYYRLSCQNQKVRYYAHRLVAEYFIPNPDNLLVVNHIDGNKLNNDISNLEWVTQSENVEKWQNDLRKERTNHKAEYYKEDLPNEIWKKVPEYDYEISSCGRIKNIKTLQLLRPSITCGYYKIILSKNRVTKGYLIHQLVYFVFNENSLPISNKDYVVDHIDSNKLNNNLNNLRKVTRSENTIAAYYNEDRTNNVIKAIVQYDKNGNYIQEFPSISSAAKTLNLDSSTISKVCRGINKTHGGFIFKYK